MKGTMRSRLYLATIVVLLLVIIAMVYKFVVAGSTAKGEDGRIAIVFAPAERALLLREMRAFVASLQLITDALSRGDMAGVANAASSVGFAKAHDAPAAMIAKLPLEFKSLAFGTHRAFDQIAADAKANATREHTLAQLSSVLAKCVACHASYQAKSSGPP